MIQYLFFELNQEHYAVKASIVKEIVNYVEITTIPKAHKAVMGITNVRGDIVPIVDPKVLFDMPKTNITKRTSFIILNIFNEEKQTTSHIAIMVDLVNEVTTIENKDILSTPQFGTKIEKKYIENMIRYSKDDEYVTVLDINNVIDIQELSKPSIG